VSKKQNIFERRTKHVLTETFIHQFRFDKQSLLRLPGNILFILIEIFLLKTKNNKVTNIPHKFQGHMPHFR